MTPATPLPEAFLRSLEGLPGYDRARLRGRACRRAGPHLPPAEPRQMEGPRHGGFGESPSRSFGASRSDDPRALVGGRMPRAASSLLRLRPALACRRLLRAGGLQHVPGACGAGAAGRPARFARPRPLRRTRWQVDTARHTAPDGPAPQQRDHPYPGTRTAREPRQMGEPADVHLQRRPLRAGEAGGLLRPDGRRCALQRQRNLPARPRRGRRMVACARGALQPPPAAHPRRGAPGARPRGRARLRHLFLFARGGRGHHRLARARTGPHRPAGKHT